MSCLDNTKPKIDQTKINSILESSGQKEGIEIWRIENLSLAPIDKKDYGKFFTGDSYIILNTIVPKNCMNLHFWIGSESTLDEYGSAALLTTYIDQYHNDVPNQYRELEGQESKEFNAMFNKTNSPYGGVKYLSGGVDSAFQKGHTNKDDQNRLLRVKGTIDNVRAKEVPFKWENVTTDDCYIFEIGSDIYRWKGAKASRIEFIETERLARHILYIEQCGRGNIEILYEGEFEWPYAIIEAFGCKLPPATFKESGVDDRNTATKFEKGASIQLYQVSYDSGKMDVTLESSDMLADKFKLSSLNDTNCYIIDQVKDSGIIHIWKGDNSELSEKQQAMNSAIQFITNNGYDLRTPIQVCNQGRESVQFRQCFLHGGNEVPLKFAVADKQNSPKRLEEERRKKKIREENMKIHFKLDDEPSGSSPINSSLVNRFDLLLKQGLVQEADRELFEQEAASNLPSLHEVFENCGKTKGTELWRVENRSLNPIPETSKQYGKFFIGDTYIALNTIEVNKEYNLHFWIGGASTMDEYGSAALIAIEMDQCLRDLPVQYREVQGKESELWRNLFPNAQYIKGGIASSAERVIINEDSKNRLLRIKRGKTEVSYQEMPFCWDSIFSDDTYIFEIGSDIYRWKGPKSSRLEFFKSIQIANDILNVDQNGRGQIHIIKGNDFPDKITEIMGCPPEVHLKSLEIQFPDSGLKDGEDWIQPPENQNLSLYKVSDDDGECKVTLTNLCDGKTNQPKYSSLETDDCYILDDAMNSGTIFVWKGPTATLEERRMAMSSATEFIKKKGYDFRKTSVQCYNAGREGTDFMMFFSK